MESLRFVPDRKIDLRKTVPYLSGLLAIGVLDFSIIAGIVWAMTKYPILQTLILTLLLLSILVAFIFAMAYRWGGKDEYEPY